MAKGIAPDFRCRADRYWISDRLVAGPRRLLSIIGMAMLVPLIPGAPIWMDKTEVVLRRTAHRAWRSVRWCFGLGTH